MFGSFLRYRCIRLAYTIYKRGVNMRDLNISWDKIEILEDTESNGVSRKQFQKHFSRTHTASDVLPQPENQVYIISGKRFIGY